MQSYCLNEPQLISVPFTLCIWGRTWAVFLSGETAHSAPRSVLYLASPEHIHVLQDLMLDVKFRVTRHLTSHLCILISPSRLVFMPITSVFSLFIRCRGVSLISKWFSILALHLKENLFLI